MKTIGTTALVCIALAGCNRATPIEDPEPAETSAPTSTPSSILRETPDPIVEEKVMMAPLEVTVPFAGGGYELDDDARMAIAEILESEQFKSGGRIVLRGHTDSVGDDEANLRASGRRAGVIKELLEEAGANPENIEIIEIGEQRPIAPNAKLDGTPDEEGRAKNRRVDVTIFPPDENPMADEEEDSIDPVPQASARNLKEFLS